MQIEDTVSAYRTIAETPLVVRGYLNSASSVHVQYKQRDILNNKNITFSKTFYKVNNCYESNSFPINEISDSIVLNSVSPSRSFSCCIKKQKEDLYMIELWSKCERVSQVLFEKQGSVMNDGLEKF